MQIELNSSEIMLAVEGLTEIYKNNELEKELDKMQIELSQEEMELAIEGLTDSYMYNNTELDAKTAKGASKENLEKHAAKCEALRVLVCKLNDTLGAVEESQQEA